MDSPLQQLFFIIWCNLSNHQQQVFEQLLKPLEYLYNITQRPSSKQIQNYSSIVYSQGFSLTRPDINQPLWIIFWGNKQFRVRWCNNWQLQFMTVCTVISPSSSGWKYPSFIHLWLTAANITTILDESKFSDEILVFSLSIIIEAVKTICCIR